eukprot:scaffold3272_cov272-Alexandrium_tamarense.AAC.1
MVHILTSYLRRENRAVSFSSVVMCSGDVGSAELHVVECAPGRLDTSSCRSLVSVSQITGFRCCHAVSRPSFPRLVSQGLLSAGSACQPHRCRQADRKAVHCSETP